MLSVSDVYNRIDSLEFVEEKEKLTFLKAMETNLFLLKNSHEDFQNLLLYKKEWEGYICPFV